MSKSPPRAEHGPGDPAVAALEAEVLRLSLGEQAPRRPAGEEPNHGHERDDSSSSSSDSSAGHPEELHPADGARAGPQEPTPPTAALPSDARVGLLYDQSMEQHFGPDEHPERPSRIIALHARLKEEGLMGRCWQLPPRQATDEELLLAHSAEHIRKVDTMFSRLYPVRGLDLRDEAFCYADNNMGDVYVCAGTARAARMAAGCCVQAVRSVLSGAVHRCLAVVRPPGHHAECERAMGFCYFNNVAVAALEALRHPGVERVAVLDWDVHHGNGIQHILYNRPDVLYISLHRDPKHFYPYTSGYVGEAGKGAGLGFNVNVPWAKKGVGDGDYMAAFSLVVEPILASFDPHLVIVAAGYDAAEGDPLGGCKLSPEGYAWMTERLMRFAGGRLVLALEGGYNNRVTAWCASACVSALLCGRASPPMPLDREHCWPADAHNSLKMVYEFHQQYWPVLAERSWTDAWEGHVKHITDLMGAAHSRPKRQPSGAAAAATATTGGSSGTKTAAAVPAAAPIAATSSVVVSSAAAARPSGAGAGGGTDVPAAAEAAAADAASSSSAVTAAATAAAAAADAPVTLQEAFLARKAAREAAAAALTAAATSWATTGAGPPPPVAATGAATDAKPAPAAPAAPAVSSSQSPTKPETSAESATRQEAAEVDPGAESTGGGGAGPSASSASVTETVATEVTATAEGPARC